MEAQIKIYRYRDLVKMLVAQRWPFCIGENNKKFIFINLNENINRFSYSCGYRKAFDEYTSILNEKYPEILITGANYDPPGMNLYLSKSILFLKFVLIIVIMSSFDIWGYLGHAIPAWYRWCSENKLYACMMVFFVGNMLEAQVSRSNIDCVSDFKLWTVLKSNKNYLNPFLSAHIIWCIWNFIERCSNLVQTTNWSNSSSARIISDYR